MVALLLLPYLDHNPERAPRRRPFVSTAALLALGSLLYLGIAGAQRGPRPVTLNDAQQRGEKVFLDLRCESCQRAAQGVRDLPHRRVLPHLPPGREAEVARRDLGEPPRFGGQA